MIYDARSDKKLSGRFLAWDDDPEPCEAWPTGNVFTDWLTGIGGLPKGRVVECYGPESSGKSTLGMQTAAHVWHTLGIPSHFADFEDAFDFRYARSLGLTTESLLLEQPETLEDYLEGLNTMLEKGANIALTIVDSVAAARTRDDLKASVDARAGGMNRARIWTQNLATLVHKLNQSAVTMLLVNQTRVFIDASGGFVPAGVKALQPKVVTPGGKGIKFYSSLRLEFEQSSEIRVPRVNPITLESEKVSVGKHVWMRCRKNKVAPPPWRAVRLQIRDGIGFDVAQNLLDFAVVHSIVEKGTAGRFTFPAAVVGTEEDLEVGPTEGFTGEQVAAQTIRAYPHIREALEALVAERLASVEVEDQAQDDPEGSQA